MKTSLFYLPTVGDRDDIEAGMAGLKPELYSKMLSEVGEQARLADDLGYHSISFTEHHFHVEGIELSNNPVLLDLFIAMQTKNIRVGQLGIVLPASNPVRVAEDIAMLDHMSGGRVDVGFARGYQRRWVDVMAQHAHGIQGALPHQHDEIDAANRAAFEDNFNIIMKCWTEDMLTHKSDLWTIPLEGTPWDIEATQKYGAGVEDGVLKAVGVVPKPLQKPHPPLFQPFASSDNSIRWCADKGATAVLPPMHLSNETRLTELYAEVSGRALGDGVAYLRDVVVADTDEEAFALWRNASRFASDLWFVPFGFRRGMIDPATGEMPSDDDMWEQGYALVGSVDTVCKRLEAMMKDRPVDWVFAWTFNALIPHDKLMRSIELYQTQVLPRVLGT